MSPQLSPKPHGETQRWRHTDSHPIKRAFRKHGDAFLSDNHRPKVRPKSRTRTRLRCPDVARLSGTGDGFIMDRRSPNFTNASTPTGIRRFDAYVYARTSQDCGSSTALSLTNIEASSRRKNNPRDATIC